MISKISYLVWNISDAIFSIGPGEQTSVKFQSNYIFKVFFQENEFQYVVCKMVDILIITQCVKPTNIGGYPK